MAARSYRASRKSKNPVSDVILLKRPGAEVGDYREYETDFQVPSFELYGRHHEVLWAKARAGVTRLAEGLHLDLEIELKVLTTCDRTLEPVDLEPRFTESELLNGPNVPELFIEDWTLDLTRYTARVVPNEVPMKVCAPGTSPVVPEQGENDVDPRWRGLDGLFAAGF
ncbi:hypothetical protein BH23ACT11_BH23ACT11_02060 [soil metagenome]